MSNLMELQGQIEKLQKQADEIKSREFDKTVQEILAKMQAFGITVKDLGTNKRKGSKGKVKVSAKTPAVAKRANSGVKKAPVAAKFRGPNGETWSGRGLMPRWLSALVAQGQPKESFAVTAQ
jgi:DNA-binding protein H-NS